MTLSYLEPMTTRAPVLSVPAPFPPLRVPQNDEPSPRHRALVGGPPVDVAIVNQAGAMNLLNLQVNPPPGHWRNEIRAQKVSSSIRCITHRSPSASPCGWTYSKP